MIRFFDIRFWVLCGLATSFWLNAPVYSDEPVRQGDWLVQDDNELGRRVYTMEMKLTPMPETRPALKHRFIPDEFDLQDGNAAIFYLKAMGFLEQSTARELLSEMRKNFRKAAEEKGEDTDNIPPESWFELSPSEIPIEEVKKYLFLTSFQPRDLAEAAKRRSFSLNRNIRQVSNPVGVLLPEIQMMRELARTQSLRCRLAIAEGRIDDAMKIIGQQYAMAKHLGTDEFLVSNLVGCAVAGISSGDAFHLLQQPTTPNLYWAFASLPNPICNLRNSLAYERQFLFEQFKILREVDETPRNTGYWEDFVGRIVPELKIVPELLNTDIWDSQRIIRDPDTARAILVATIAAGYPGAKRYLIDVLKLDRDKVESYCTAQVFFLAVKRYYENTRDDHFKWNFTPISQAIANDEFRNLDGRMKSDSQRLGWASIPTTTFLASITAARQPTMRVQQSIAFLQTVEAIRMYGANNAGKLPESLESLPVPAPADPFTGKPLTYERSGDKATLTGYPLTGMQYRVVVRFVK
jgi:hypothetical protein